MNDQLKVYAEKTAELIKMYREEGPTEMVKKLGVSRWHVTCWATMMKRMGVLVGKAKGWNKYPKEFLDKAFTAWNTARSMEVFASIMAVNYKDAINIRYALLRNGFKLKRVKSKRENYTDIWNSSSSKSEFMKKMNINRHNANAFYQWAEKKNIKLKKMPDERTVKFKNSAT